ncbi:MAG: hypothetical protein NTW07_10290 [candidate division Zixibacteria bacterium]|nr:hypothetical protein [candidate division Zixibacteria bacterium]
MNNESVVFATYAENPEALANICLLTESLRSFGGRLSAAPVWVYIPEDLTTKVLADTAVVNSRECYPRCLQVVLLRRQTCGRCDCRGRRSKQEGASCVAG